MLLFFFTYFCILVILLSFSLSLFRVSFFCFADIFGAIKLESMGYRMALFV